MLQKSYDMDSFRHLSDPILLKLKTAFEGPIGVFAEKVRFAKNEFLLSPGQKCRYYYFITEGLLANYYIKDGEEVVTSFTFPGDIGVEFKSAVLKIVSKDYIKALSSVEAYRISVAEFDKKKHGNHELIELENELVVAYALLLEERLYFLQHNSAVERYNYLLSNYPEYIQYIPLKYIASYLGVKLETLSRIRAQQ
ncbi:MAG: Crp/Fnr family transcriptional regulator [Sphingobacterium sp.]|jgi:CRP-like cAMP-binding protein|nr:Crp/Fnr family transcriptional regulator [Sphingobacterium sp.]